ncbi:hypothetical protein [Isoptericola sp. NPDC055881]
MSRGLPPAETLVVTGGRGLARVDADAVQGAAALLDAAADGLRRASGRCSAARAALQRPAWVPDPAAGPFPPPPTAHEVARTTAAAARLDDATVRLHGRATGAERCARRLRFAAGLYRAAESLADRAVGTVVTVAAGAAGAWLGVKLLPLQAAAQGTAVGRRLWGPSAPSDPRREVELQAVPAPAPTLVTPTTGYDGPAANLWRVLAPSADETVAGLGAGLALTTPWTWRDLERGVREGPAAMTNGVTRGAGALSDVVAALLPASEVRVLALADADLAGPPPGWTDQPSGTVEEALARVGDLYAQGSGIVGRPAAGVPAGTLAVEQVEHADGSTSWTVLIPGTQAGLSVTHPFDAATDLQLMAHDAADVSVAVEQALDQAGATDDEPVVLVGHSLGGIAATALAASPAFRSRHPVGGVVTAGSPTGSFATPTGVPVLHLENDEELVSALDGGSAAENPQTTDRVTVGRRLLDSTDPADRTAAGAIVLAHGLPTHLRTFAAVRDSGNFPAAGVTQRLERLLGGTRAQTRLVAVRRVEASTATVLAPGPVPGTAPGTAGSTRTVTVPPTTTSPPPGVPAGATLH